eukprot:GHVS01033239.1.p1 GENE.GHVS01033239.1~~GHVS01033239.1.p1  ORF type:complete len:326 (-),score=54.21 GHVS01033239.1:338-1315(-)
MFSRGSTGGGSSLFGASGRSYIFGNPATTNTSARLSHAKGIYTLTNATRVVFAALYELFFSDKAMSSSSPPCGGGFGSSAGGTGGVFGCAAPTQRRRSGCAAPTQRRRSGGGVAFGSGGGGGLFGATASSAPLFGQQPSSRFGQPASQPVSTGMFGSSSSFFGKPSVGVKYNPVNDGELNGRICHLLPTTEACGQTVQEECRFEWMQSKTRGATTGASIELFNEVAVAKGRFCPITMGGGMFASTSTDFAFPSTDFAFPSTDFASKFGRNIGQSLTLTVVRVSELANTVRVLLWAMSWCAARIAKYTALLVVECTVMVWLYLSRC